MSERYGFIIGFYGVRKNEELETWSSNEWNSVL